MVEHTFSVSYSLHTIDVSTVTNTFTIELTTPPTNISFSNGFSGGFA